MNGLETWMVLYDPDRRYDKRCDTLHWKIWEAPCEPEIYKEDHYILLFYQLAGML
jgi:hypothetical protein